MTASVHADDTDDTGNLDLAEAIKNDDIDAVMAFLEQQGAWRQSRLIFDIDSDEIIVNDPWDDESCDGFTIIAVVDSYSESGIHVSQIAHFDCGYNESETSDFEGRFNVSWKIDNIQIDQDSEIDENLEDCLGDLPKFNRFIPRRLDINNVCRYLGTSSEFTRKHLAWEAGASREIVDFVCSQYDGQSDCYPLARNDLFAPCRECFLEILNGVFKNSKSEVLEWGRFGSISADDDAGDIYSEREGDPGFW